MIAEGKKIEECFEYLKDKGTTPFTDLFIYYEEDGEIKACAGLMAGLGYRMKIGIIEPMQAENKMSSFRLYNQAIGYLKGTGCTHILTGSNKAVVWDTLEHLGYKAWHKNIKQYIKEI